MSAAAAQGSQSAEVVIVGAGSAGCVLARRLVDAGLRVTLLEAGPPDNVALVHDPAGMFPLIGSEYDWAYATIEQPGCESRRIPFPRGKVLGGSSSINGMIYARGDRSDFDSWARAGNDGWAYDDVLPLFKRAESFDRGESEFHGGSGPLHVMSEYEPHPLLAAMTDASVEAGIVRNPDYNGESLDGVAFVHLNIKDGQRISAARGFLAPVADAEELTIRTGCHVRKVLFEGDRCVGVEMLQAGKLEVVRAEQEVVICAGAIDSPKLLMLSGIGPADELAGHGIDVVADLPGVGRNLQDHLASPVVFSASKAVPPGIVGLQEFHAHLFWRSRPGLIGPDIQSVFAHLPVYPDGGEGPPHGFSFMSMLVRPASHGTVKLTSGDSAAPPLIDPRFLTCEADLDAIAAGIELLREVGRQNALAEWRGEELFPGNGVRTRRELHAYVRASAVTIHHPAGTCRMGIDELAVVDPALRVRGVTGLRVADASVMPSVTSANTHAPTVMIGERAADLVAGRPLFTEIYSEKATAH